MLVKDFEQNKKEMIPDAFYDCLPKMCLEHNCGFPIIMTEALTELQCSNPSCPGKVTFRLTKLLKDLEITYIKEKDIKEYVLEHNVKNIFSVFDYNFDRDGCFSSGVNELISKSLEHILHLKKTFTLLQYIHAANLPFLNESIESIFGGFNDLQEFFTTLEEYGVTYLENKLGMDKDDTELAVKILKIYEVLIVYKKELLEGLDYINLI